MLYLPDDQIELLLPLLSAADKAFVHDADAVLPVPEGGIDEYLAMRPTRKRQFSGEIRRFERSGCVVRVRGPLRPPGRAD